jgi:hypothetical protein
MGDDRPVARLSTRRVVAAAATVALGLAAVTTPYLRVGVTPGLLDLAVGWTLMGCGLALFERGPRRAAVLLYASGIAWFALDFSPLLSSGLRPFLDATSLAYVALLANAIFVVPSGRLTSRVSAAAVATTYAVAVAAAIGYYRVGLIGAGAVVLGSTVVVWYRMRARTSPAAIAVVGAGVSLGAALLVTSTIRLLEPSAISEPVLTRVFNTATVVTAVLVLIAGSTPSVASTGVDLAADGDKPLEKVLSKVLGVPRLSVVFPANDGTWIDYAGRLAVEPHSRFLAVHDDDDAIVAMLGIEAEIPSDVYGPLRDLLRLVGAHARLQREVRMRLVDLADSRLRLVEAGDGERRQLESQLRRGALARVDRISTILDGFDALGSLRERVTVTRRELDRIARGLDPLANGGFDIALRDLAARSPLCVQVNTFGDVLSDQVGRAVWFACAEALSNTAKHAADASVEITITSTDTAVVAVIADDGPGGAIAAGSGLRGLADRAGALGGTFEVTSAGCGTRIVMALPTPYESTRRKLPC